MLRWLQRREGCAISTSTVSLRPFQLLRWNTVKLSPSVSLTSSLPESSSFRTWSLSPSQLARRSSLISFPSFFPSFSFLSFPFLFSFFFFSFLFLSFFSFLFFSFLFFSYLFFPTSSSISLSFQKRFSLIFLFFSKGFFFLKAAGSSEQVEMFGIPWAFKQDELSQNVSFFFKI